MARARVGGIITVAAIIGASSVAFIVLGGISQGYSVDSIIVLGAMGAFFGAISAPELEPKIFRFPTIWQICCSVAGSLLVAFVFKSGAEGYLLAVVLGVFIGYFAPFWIKHVSLP
jgi:hypothetical protein